MKLRNVIPGLFALGLFVAVFSPGAHADDALRRAKVEQLFTLTHLDQTYGQIIHQVLGQSDQMAKDMFPNGATTDAQRKELADFQTRVTGLVTDSFSWEALKPAYIDLYAKEYTEDELDGMIAFYRSPVGQSMLAKTIIIPLTHNQL